MNTEKLNRLMKEHFYTNATLAAAIGVNAQTISRLRTGKTEPRPATLQKLCETLHCTPQELLK